MRAALCALFFFLTMVSYYILKPVREAVFLHTQGIERVPLSHVAVSVTSFFAVQAYAWMARRVPGRRLVVWLNGSFVLTILLFRAILDAQPTGHAQTAFAWSYYIWVSIFAVYAVTLFWSFAHDVFTPEEGSRFYGYIGAGGIVGAMVGSIATEHLVTSIGAPALFLASAALLIPCMGIATYLASRAPSTGGAPKRTADGSAGAIELFRTSRYLCGVLVLVFLYQALAIFVDYETKAIIKRSFGAQDLIAAFQARMYLRANVIGALINLLATGWLQTRFGPLPGLLTLPVVGSLGAIGFLLDPVLAVAEWITVLGLGVTYSIHQSSKELLYLPLPSTERYVAKGFIDTFVFRLGNGAASLWLLMVVPAIGAVSASAMILATCIAMIATDVWLSRRHAAIVAGRETVLPKPADE